MNRSEAETRPLRGYKAIHILNPNPQMGAIPLTLNGSFLLERDSLEEVDQKGVGSFSK
ncbi:hypothetical protein ACQKE5_16695 [Paenisporosarcina sp. NPDC076898]|uniref:hypothetical protein n=1 Tax=Paenisporosarcina sp. NPDC076898 TaxID=3390603 RepID=UPI003D07DE4C